MLVVATDGPFVPGIKDHDIRIGTFIETALSGKKSHDFRNVVRGDPGNIVGSDPSPVYSLVPDIRKEGFDFRSTVGSGKKIIFDFFGFRCVVTPNGIDQTVLDGFPEGVLI